MRLAVSPAVTFVAVDFDAESTAVALAAAGLAPERPVFYSWLGVVPYLAEPSLDTVLAEIAAHAGGADVVFDYSNSPEQRSAHDRERFERRREVVAALGEPWHSTNDTLALHAKLEALGFDIAADLDPRALMTIYASDLAPRSPEAGGHVVLARKT
jgi:O-methyltransferase involved in polyketide biosynthesis